MNEVRELLKFVDSGTMGDLKQMKILVIFINSTRYLGVKLKPKFNDDFTWRMRLFVDDYWLGNKYTLSRISFWVI